MKNKTGGGLVGCGVGGDPHVQNVLYDIPKYTGFGPVYVLKFKRNFRSKKS